MNRAPVTSSASTLPGYLLTETLISLAIASVLIGGVIGVVPAASDNVRRLADRLESERMLTAAQITVLAVVREGFTVPETVETIRREYPLIEATYHDGRLVLVHATRDSETAIEIVLSARESAR